MQVCKRAPHGIVPRPSMLGVKLTLEWSHTCTMKNAAPATTPPYAHRLSPASRTRCCSVHCTSHQLAQSVYRMAIYCWRVVQAHKLTPRHQSRQRCANHQ